MSMIVIDKLCKGCAACVDVCPNQAISHFAKTAKIDQELCQDCENVFLSVLMGRLRGLRETELIQGERMI
jgi:ferredoxin